MIFYLPKQPLLVNICMFKLSNYQQTLIVQSALYLTALAGLIFAFSWAMLLLGLVVGWVIFCLGVSISLHKHASHRTFEPRNRVIKLLLLWLGAQCTLGSNIGFAAGHRQHHRASDTETDPFVLTNSLWHNIKLWFYHFPTDNISPRLIKDLTSDDDYKFVHKHYWKIWAVVPTTILTLGGPVVFAYCFALPMVYVFLGMSYVTVVAHSSTWRRWFSSTSNFDTHDQSWDSKFFTVLFAGEGYHHTHHAKPGEYSYSIPGKQFDFSGYVIKYLKKD